MLENTEQSSNDCLLMTSKQSPNCCKHWVLRKKRYCRMTAAKGSEYCAEHEPVDINACMDEDVCKGTGRILCPLDNGHTVRSKNLRKHLHICNARPLDKYPDYIVKNINSGLQLREETDDSPHNLRLSSISEDDIQAVIVKVKYLYKRFVENEIHFADYEKACLKDELAKTDYGKQTRKHILQIAALLNILRHENLIDDCTSFVEFGSGKGQLAYYLAEQLKTTNNSQVILLDRKGLRHKKDNKIENRSLVQRIRVDIADVCFDKLPKVAQSAHCVAFSKHLCGSATDLALRCVTQAKQKPLDFIMIAVCCHHCCEWNPYVGKEFLQQNQISKRDFSIMCRLVSWAVCGTGMSRERRKLQLEDPSNETKVCGNAETNHGLSLIERESIGFMCKRILDYGRVHYLQAHNYAAQLKYYVPQTVTLENVIITAKKL